MGYIIIGDTEKYSDCLVQVLNTSDRDEAEQRLQKFVDGTDYNTMRLKEGHTNFRIEWVKPEDEWWNDPFLAN